MMTTDRCMPGNFFYTQSRNTQWLSGRMDGCVLKFKQKKSRDANDRMTWVNGRVAPKCDQQLITTQYFVSH